MVTLTRTEHELSDSAAPDLAVVTTLDSDTS